MMYLSKRRPPAQVVVGDIPREPRGFVTRHLLNHRAEASKHKLVAVVYVVNGLRGVGKTQVAAAYARFCGAIGWGLAGGVNARAFDRMLAGPRSVAHGLA